MKGKFEVILHYDVGTSVVDIITDLQEVLANNGNLFVDNEWEICLTKKEEQ